jgi:hypothetical protein
MDSATGEGAMRSDRGIHSGVVRAGSDAAESGSDLLGGPASSHWRTPTAAARGTSPQREHPASRGRNVSLTTAPTSSVTTHSVISRSTLRPTAFGCGAHR